MFCLFVFVFLHSITKHLRYVKCYNYNLGLVHWQVLSKCWCCRCSFHIISAPPSVTVSDLSGVALGLAQSPGGILFYG